MGREKWKVKKRQLLFVGKALHQFCDDADGCVTGFELDCLEAPVGETTVLKSRPKTLQRDTDIFPIFNIIDQVKVEPLRGDQWSVPNYRELKEKFKRAIMIDRDELFGVI